MGRAVSEAFGHTRLTHSFTLRLEKRSERTAFVALRKKQAAVLSPYRLRHRSEAMVGTRCSNEQDTNLSEQPSGLQWTIR